MSPRGTVVRRETVQDDAAEELLASVFEERAENLSQEELERWTALTDGDRAILSKLKGPGAKLLTGPRGSGKSTLLKTAYYELLKEGDVLGVYVNYSKSLALEPLFHKQSNAIHLFRQWVVQKIVVSVHLSVKALKKGVPPALEDLAEEGTAFIRSLEIGDEPQMPSKLLAPSQLLLLLEDWTQSCACKRTVLLLDDAAHAFSSEQQREFFEVMRELRSRTVSAKAAVYPGVTAYSPNFHVGHEAELVEAWYRPEEPGYLGMMRDIVDKRLPPELAERLKGREDVVDYLAMASFGLPRGFLVMLSAVLGVEEEANATRPTRQRTQQSVSSYAASVRDIFQTLASKLPRFVNFIGAGAKLERALLRTLRTYNADHLQGHKATTVAIAEPIGNEVLKVLSFLEYTGMVRRQDTVSRGVKGVFQRYMIHYALILNDNSLSLGKSFTLQAAVEALLVRNAHAFVRTRIDSLISEEVIGKCTLDLGPCKKCGTPRISEDARFCMKCGTKLTDASVYEELLKASIEKLPLTENKLRALNEYTNISTVKDILMDHDSHQLRTVPYVGPVWAKRIKNYAEEFVSV